MNNKQKKGGVKTESRSWLAFLRSEIMVSVGLVTFVAAVAIVSIIGTINHLAQGDQTEETTEEVVEMLRHPLTGEVMEEELGALPAVFAVMVENAADAWPLSGINDAFLVIEAPVEGGIPRFVTFFSEEADTVRIGPVRSARPYYVQWVQAFGAVYAHVGGSPEALDLIKTTADVKDLNQFWYGQYFYRDEVSRYAPHNVYTTMTKLQLALDNVFEETEVTYDGWLFKEDEPAEEEHEQLVEVDFAQASIYDVAWEYDQATNAYLRYQGLSPMILEDGARVYANNVIIMATDIRSIDAVDRKRITVLGEGDALIVQDGQSFLATWKKDTEKDQLRFTRADGEVVRLNAGTTWMEIVEELSAVTQ